MEIGVHAGDFAELMNENLTIKKMYLIDPFTNEDQMSSTPRFNSNTNLDFVEKRFSNKNIVEILQGHSSHLLPNFIQLKEHEKIDFIYIDSNHLFINTYNEILYSSQILSDDGIIGLDDCTNYSDDPRQLNEVLNSVTSFLANNKNWQVAYYSFNDAGWPNIYLSKIKQNHHQV